MDGTVGSFVGRIKYKWLALMAMSSSLSSETLVKSMRLLSVDDCLGYAESLTVSPKVAFTCFAVSDTGKTMLFHSSFCNVRFNIKVAALWG